MKLRHLTAEGVAEFSECLAAARTGEIRRGDLEQRVAALKNASREVAYEIPDTWPAFTTRLEVGEFLATKLTRAPAEVLGDQATWTWLALTFFDVICPASAGPPGDDARYILAEESQRYYRHLLYGPWRAVTAHPTEHDGLRVLLGNAPDRPGDIWEQIASRQGLISSAPIVRALGRLYYDSVTERPRSGAAGNGPGSVRRFVRVIDQLDCTWDLWAVPLGALLEMLPDEFERYQTGH